VLATAAVRTAHFTIVGRLIEHGPDVPAPDRPDLVTGRLAPRADGHLSVTTTPQRPGCGV
jgi:hypothetical protein